MKTNNFLIPLLILLIIAVNPSYANTVVKKIKYAKNVYYKGEAVNTGNIWQPNGIGTLYILFPNTLKIEGRFKDAKVSEAQVMIGENAQPVFNGDLTFAILPKSTNTGYDDIQLSFLSGDITSSNGYRFTLPSSIDYMLDEKNKGVKISADVRKDKELDIAISRFIEFNGADPIFLQTDKDYSVKIDGSIHISNNGLYFKSSGIREVNWSDGASLSFNGDYTQTAYSEKRGGIIYDGINRMYIFRCKLSDETIVDGIINNIDMQRYGNLNRLILIGKPFYITKVECTDGRTLDNSSVMNFNDVYRSPENGAMIKGIETVQDLFTKYSVLTKKDITILNGVLLDKNGTRIDYFRDGEGKYGEFPFFE